MQRVEVYHRPAHHVHRKDGQLFHVDITIEIPADADREKIKELSAQETVLAQELQCSGEWRHIWRIVGKWANLSIFDAPDASRLHEILTSLQLLLNMNIRVTPICKHPAGI